MASTKKKTETKVKAPKVTGRVPGRTAGIPEEKVLFDQLSKLATTFNQLGSGIEKVYKYKTPVLKTDFKIPACTARTDDDELGGISAEKSLFAQLKNISSSLNKMTTNMQKDIQKAVKAKAAAKRTVAKKTTAKKAK